MRRRSTLGWLVLLLLALIGVREVVPVRGAPSQEPSAVEEIRAGCDTFNPFFATTNFSHVADIADEPDKPAVIAFRDTANDDVDVQHVLATHEQVGAVYGLAYDAAREELYAAAYHKRSTKYGPGGPGQIYRIDIASGSVTSLATLSASDRHDYRSDEDLEAARWVGIASLGDIDLDEGATELFATNLMEGRIYRLRVADGAEVGSYRHGAAGEEWAINARLFGLAYHDGWLYHGVVDSRERSSEPGSLRGLVYRSRADGSSMEQVLEFPLNYTGRTSSWTAWGGTLPPKIGNTNSYRQYRSEAMLADIEFTTGGDMVIGLRDRVADMLPVLDRYVNQPGVGDLLIARQTGGRWTVVTQPEPYADDIGHPDATYNECGFGGVAAFPGFDIVVGSAAAPTRPDGVGGLWFWNTSGDRLREESLELKWSTRNPSGSNGLGDVESLCPKPDVPNPTVVPTATAVVATATARAAATQTAVGSTATAMPAVTPGNFPTVVAEACIDEDDNPYAATVCYPLAMNFGQPNWDGASIVVFRDTNDDGAVRLDDAPIYWLASHKTVGATWGLAFSSREGAVYASAFHKRLVEYSAGGTGAIHRLDVGTGEATLFAKVPESGPDTHEAPGLRVPDTTARDWAGKVSLGDIDLNDDESELFVVNLYGPLVDEKTHVAHIYRYDVATGALLSSFPHGAVNEPWRVDARPFGLEFHAGRLYHGLVNSAESTDDSTDLRGYVYSSAPDGSDMRLELSFPLDYDRGEAVVAGVLNRPEQHIPLAWLPWDHGYNDLADKQAQLALYPQPMLSDIEFLESGDMVLGLRDRHEDMALSYQISIRGTIRKPGVGVGDILLAKWNGGGWDEPDANYYQGLHVGTFDRTGSGSLAHFERLDQILMGRVAPGGTGGYAPTLREQVIWYDGSNQIAHEYVCRIGSLWRPTPRATPVTQPRPLSPNFCEADGDRARVARDEPYVPLHNEWVPSRAMGDIEVLCGPTPTPSATPSWSPTPRPSRTPTKTPSPTLSPSPTPTRTPKLEPIYLPILVKDHCDPRYQHVDVVLVIDASTTMLYETRAGRMKIEAAKEAASLFLDHMKFPGDQAALVSFNIKATVHLGLSGDRQALKTALAGITNEEFTRIHLGIEAAHDLLTGTQRIADNTPAMIVLSDGISNPDPVRYALDAAKAAKEDGIAIYTVGLGEDIEVEALTEMASRPGMYYHAPDGEDLGPIYEEIAHEIPCPPSAYWPHRP